MLTWLYILKDYFVSSDSSLLLVVLVGGQIQVVERGLENRRNHLGTLGCLGGWYCPGIGVILTLISRDGIACSH